MKIFNSKLYTEQTANSQTSMYFFSQLHVKEFKPHTFNQFQYRFSSLSASVNMQIDVFFISVVKKNGKEIKEEKEKLDTI